MPVLEERPKVRGIFGRPRDDLERESALSNIFENLSSRVSDLLVCGFDVPLDESFVLAFHDGEAAAFNPPRPPAEPDVEHEERDPNDDGDSPSRVGIRPSV